MKNRLATAPHDKTVTTTVTSGDQRPTRRVPRIVVVGGGFVGLTLTRQLQHRLRNGEAEVVLVDAAGSMVYQPFLAEVAAGRIEGRHVSVPLQTTLHGTTVIRGLVTAVDVERQSMRISLDDGTEVPLSYDELVLAPGSVTRTQPVPGLTQQAVGFTTLAEAVWLRDNVISRLTYASQCADPRRREAACSFVIVGGGYSGIEAAAELHDLADAVARRTPGLNPTELRFEVIEAGQEIIPEMSAPLGAWTRTRLGRRGVTVRTQTQVVTLTNGHVELSDGDHFEADTIVWAAGVRANPLLSQSELPLDARGRVRTSATLRVIEAAHLWAAGDGAAVPDLTTLRPDGSTALCGATAQHAIRQAKVLAKNLVAHLRGNMLLEYRHRDAGSVAGLGLHDGVARIYGVPLRGLPAWILHRAYHLAMVPTWGCKVRVALGWLAALLSRRDAVATGLSTRPMLKS